MAQYAISVHSRSAHRRLFFLAALGFALTLCFALFAPLANAGCYGNQCTKPSTPQMTGLSVIGGAGTGGVSVANRKNGLGGHSWGSSDGGSAVDIGLWAGGSGCGSACGDAKYSVDAGAWQLNRAGSFDIGKNAQATTGTASTGSVFFEVEKSTATPPKKD